jgi:hypothetical protein
MDESAIRKENLRRFGVALNNHSFDGWLIRLLSVLTEGVVE